MVNIQGIKCINSIIDDVVNSGSSAGGMYTQLCDRLDGQMFDHQPIWNSTLKSVIVKTQSKFFTGYEFEVKLARKINELVHYRANYNEIHLLARALLDVTKRKYQTYELFYRSSITLDHCWKLPVAKGAVSANDFKKYLLSLKHMYTRVTED